MWKRFPVHILLEQQFYTRKELPAGQAAGQAEGKTVTEEEQ